MTYRTSQNSTSIYASTYRSIKHSFNSCLPQDVVLKYTQHCTSMTVHRRFWAVSKRQGPRTGPLPLSRGIKFLRLHRSLILLLFSFPTTPKSLPSRRSMLAHSALLPKSHPFPLAPLISHATAEKTTPASCGAASTRIHDRSLQLRCC